jgi:hypothetical protein
MLSLDLISAEADQAYLRALVDELSSYVTEKSHGS